MSKAKPFLLFFILVILIFILIWFGPEMSDWQDWKNTYRPAALAVAHGRSPYTVEIYYAAPWAVIPLIPFALLPERFGYVLFFLFGLSTFTFIAYKLGAKPIS